MNHVRQNAPIGLHPLDVQTLLQGRIVAAGTPEQIAACPESKTGHYIEI